MFEYGVTVGSVFQAHAMGDNEGWINLTTFNALKQEEGSQIYRAFEQWAKTLGAKEIRLSVAQQNEAALRFWQRLGFLELERKPPERFGAKESVFILMNRVLLAD